jgi:hypothetical protein
MWWADAPGSDAVLPTPEAAGAAPSYFQDLEDGDSLSTQVSRDFLNMLMLEVVNVILAAGISLSKTSYTQLRDAIKFLATGGVIHALDVGAANAYVINPTQALGAYVEGVTFSIHFLHANTGASTLNVSALGAQAITRADGSPLQAADIPANGEGLVIYDGTNFQLLDKLVGSATTLVAGTVALASASMVQAGTDATHAVTSAAMALSAKIQTLADGSTVNWPMDQGYGAKWTLAAAHALTLSGYQEGLTYALEVFPANHAPGWPGSIDWGQGGVPPTLSSGSYDISLRCVDAAAPRFKGSWN